MAPIAPGLGTEVTVGVALLGGFHLRWSGRPLPGVPRAPQRLHALEALADRLTATGRWGEAADAAGAAVRAEPLRERANAALIRVHLAEGNQSEAVRQFDRYRALLDAELGLQPTRRLRRLVQDLRTRDR